MTAEEIATLYLAQADRWMREEKGVEDDEVNALFLWEQWICDDPERAWPVFLEIVKRRADDETLYQVSHRLRILLHEHWDTFHERVAAFVRETPRLGRIVGEDFLDPKQYPLDVEKLIRAHERVFLRHSDAHRVEKIMEQNPQRGLRLAVEIIHRGPAHGLDSFDTFDPLRHLLWKNGAAVIDELERIASESYLVRRCFWRMIADEHGKSAQLRIEPAIWTRVLAANRGTTDFTDDTDPQPAAQQLSADDELLLRDWFEYEKNFWAFSAMNDLVDVEPETAWTIFLEMLRRARDPLYVSALAAGPLEDLLKDHGELLFDRIAEEARSNAKLREALRGVWIFEDHSMYERYAALMQTLG